MKPPEDPNQIKTRALQKNGSHSGVERRVEEALRFYSKIQKKGQSEEKHRGASCHRFSSKTKRGWVRDKRIETVIN